MGRGGSEGRGGRGGGCGGGHQHGLRWGVWVGINDASPGEHFAITAGDGKDVTVECDALGDGRQGADVEHVLVSHGLRRWNGGGGDGRNKEDMVKRWEGVGTIGGQPR